MGERSGDKKYLAYGLYTSALLLFGTNGIFVAHISLRGSQIVLLRTFIGGVLLSCLVLFYGGFDKDSVREERRLLLLGGAALGLNWVSLFEAYRMLNVSLATLIIFNKKITRTNGMQTAAIELDVAFAVVLVYTLCTSGLPNPAGSDLPYIAAIGFINTGLAYLLYFSGLQKLSGQSVVLMSYIDPVSALFLSAIVLHEVMTPVQVIGAALIIGGAVFGEIKKQRK